MQRPLLGMIIAILMTQWGNFHPSSADEVIPTERVSRGVVVRETSDSESPPVGSLQPGDAAEYLGEEAGKFHIRLQNGTDGFVSKSWTRRTASAPAGGELRLSFIDVGQGDSTLIECPNGKYILVDAGSTTDPQEEEIRSYLLERLGAGQPSIDTLVITHPDKDHYNLLPDLLHGITVDHLYRVGALKDYLKSFQGWLKDIPSDDTSVLKADDFDPQGAPNRNIDCGDANVWVLAAGIKATKSASNAKSIVLMIKYGGFSAILTGDATFDTEKAILSRYDAGWLDVDLLKIGHHGSLATSTSHEWVDKLKPEYAVVSAGYENGYGHPRKEIIDRVALATIEASSHSMCTVTGKKGAYRYHDTESYNEAIYATAVDGSIVVTTAGGNDIRVSTFVFEE